MTVSNDNIVAFYPPRLEMQEDYVHRTDVRGAVQVMRQLGKNL